MNRQHQELELRVTNRKRELIEEIIEHKKNSSRYGASEAIHKIAQQLSELPQIVQDSGWSKLGEGTRARLLEWIAR